MRKRLLIKNFVAQMLDQERSQAGRDKLTREITITGKISVQNKPIQTRINENDMDQEFDQDEEFQNEQDYKNSNQMSDDETEETEESLSDEESEDQVESVKSTQTGSLPAISSLNTDPHRQNFTSHNQYLGHNELEDNREDLNVDVEIETNDDMTSNGYELFSKTSIPAETGCHKVAPPSWHESEPDLYMLERSAPSLYYDEYSNGQTGVQTADSYGLTYRHDDFTVPHSQQNDMYHLCTEQSQYMISSANNNNTISGLSIQSSITTPHLALNEGAICHPQQNSPPQQLPENFMDEPVVSNDLSPSSLPIISTTTTTYAELHTTTLTVSQQSILSSNSSQHFAGHSDYASSDLLDQTVDVEDLCNVEDKARVVEEEVSSDSEEEDGTSEDEEENASPFVDLINMTPSPVKQILASDCRIEALQEATFGSRHITDLDTQLTLIEEDEFADSHPHHLIMADYDPLMLQADLVTTEPTFPNTNFANLPVSGNHHQDSTVPIGRSPRKRLNPLDYGMTLMALSPKRIKL